MPIIKAILSTHEIIKLVAWKEMMYILAQVFKRSIYQACRYKGHRVVIVPAFYITGVYLPFRRRGKRDV